MPVASQARSVFPRRSQRREAISHMYESFGKFLTCPNDGGPAIVMICRAGFSVRYDVESDLHAPLLSSVQHLALD